MNGINYLTPFRWYNQFYKQSRFEKDCDMICSFDLITDKNHLLPFQFKRMPNPNPIADWILRPSCNAAFEKLIPQADSTFTTLNKWAITQQYCEGDTAVAAWYLKNSGSNSAIQAVNLTTGKTIGYAQFDTDVITTVTNLIASINTNTPNGTPFNLTYPFDNSMGFVAYGIIAGMGYDAAIQIAAPVGGTGYNGMSMSLYFDFGAWTVDPSANQSLSGGDDGRACDSWAKSCENLKTTDAPFGKITYSGALVPGTKYRLYIKVSEWANPGGNFIVYVKNNTTIITQYNTPPVTGVLTIEFTATNPDFHLEYAFKTAEDFIVIDEIQIYEPFAIAGDDIVLDKSLIQLANTGGITGADYISYCGADLGQSISQGEYYSIIRFLDGFNHLEENNGTYMSDGYAYFFSEIIKVKDFIPEASPYIRLEWSNDCDIDDIKYTTILNCTYFNRLYIDGVLTKPEYPITEKGKSDGNEDFNPTFQKWNKKRDLQFSKVPEFLIDSLTAIRLHDSITVYEAVRDNQELINEAVNIKSVEHELQWILNDCRATFTLKCLIVDKVVDETCCNNIAISTCRTCDLTADYYNDDSSIIDGATAIFYGGYNSYVNGYYIYSTDSNSWVQQLPTSAIYVCIPGHCVFYEVTGAATKQMPEITSQLIIGGNTRLKGNILPDTYAQAQYSLDSGTTWIDIGQPVNKAQFAASHGITFPIPGGSPIYRVKMFDLACVYCYSDDV